MILTQSNNRFLQKVNPQITRVLADSGSSLEHPEIQQSMRQMVDMGVINSLKLWIHSGLIKTRTSGSDLFVTKAYDISGANRDVSMSTETNQPKLVSLGMSFDGNDRLRTINTTDFNLTDSITIMFWTYVTADGFYSPTWVHKNDHFAIRKYATTPNYEFQWNSGYTEYNYDTDSLPLNTWIMITFTVLNNTTVNIYQNTTTLSSSIRSWSRTRDLASHLGIGYSPVQTGFLTGTMNDIRIFNIALLSTQIAEIFNATKSKYGVT